MSDPGMIREIQQAVSIPVMAKCRIGHFAEAQILQALEIDYIDESEVLTPADDRAPRRQVGLHGPVRLRRHQPRRGAAAHRRGGGDDPHEGRGGHRRRRQRGHAHAGRVRRYPAARSRCARDELYTEAKDLQAPYELVRWVAENGRLPVVTFTAGGIATPADASLCMQLGRRRRLRRLRHLQVGRPATCARRRSSRRRPTTRTRRSWPRSRRGSASRWWASRPPRSRTPSGSKSAAGDAVRPDRGCAYSRPDFSHEDRRPGGCRERSASTRRCCGGSAPRSSRCACRSNSRASTGSSSRAASRRR